jgi:hypothetical protein
MHVYVYTATLTHFQRKGPQTMIQGRLSNEGVSQSRRFNILERASKQKAICFVRGGVAPDYKSDCRVY